MGLYVKKAVSAVLQNHQIKWFFKSAKMWDFGIRIFKFDIKFWFIMFCNISTKKVNHMNNSFRIIAFRNFCKNGFMITFFKSDQKTADSIKLKWTHDFLHFKFKFIRSVFSYLVVNVNTFHAWYLKN